MGVIRHIDTETKQAKLESGGALTAQLLAPLFMKHSNIHFDFPDITAGIFFDKVPSILVYFVKNKEYKMLEVFNDGTEDVKDLQFETSADHTLWQSKNKYFMYEFDDPMKEYTHYSFVLKKSERQYISNVPTNGGFYWRLSGIGCESGKTLVKDGFVEPTFL